MQSLARRLAYFGPHGVRPCSVLCQRRPSCPRHRLRARAQQQQPYSNTPGVTPQDELFRQMALRTVWSSRLSTAALALGRLLRAAASFLASCRDVLPAFTVLSPAAAARRMVLILAASLLMVVLITTIDSALLYTYVRSVRRLA